MVVGHEGGGVWGGRVLPTGGGVWGGSYALTIIFWTLLLKWCILARSERLYSQYRATNVMRPRTPPALSCTFLDRPVEENKSQLRKIKL